MRLKQTTSRDPEFAQRRTTEGHPCDFAIQGALFREGLGRSVSVFPRAASSLQYLGGRIGKLVAGCGF